MRIIVILLTLLLFSNCCKKETTVPLSQETMDYFVNHEVGTKWVYHDTFSNRYDTIELYKKTKTGTLDEVDNVYYEGYRLSFNPSVSRDFYMEISSTHTGVDRVEMVPKAHSTGGFAGAILWGYEKAKDTWTNNNFYETFSTKDQTHYDVLEGLGHASYYYYVYVSKVGLVKYISRNNVNEIKGGDFYLTEIIKE